MKKIFNTLFSLAVLLSGFAFVSCEEKAETLEGNPVLSVSSDIIIADGEDELVLTVKVAGTDVTDDAKLYVNNKPMNGHVFTTTETGDYKFYASYNGKISNTKTITAANPALYVELPEDSQADKFEGFQRKVLVAEATGTWCGYCPFMIKGLELFHESGSNAGNAVVVAIHSGDEFSNTASEAAVSASKVSGFPTCVLNLNPEAEVQSYTNAEVNAENINAAVSMEMMEGARVGIAAATAVNADSSMVAVRAAVKVGVEGNYRINAWLIEDGVAANQSSYWDEFSDGMASVRINHNHILRAASCVSPIQGGLLAGKSKCTAGDVVEYYYEFNTKSASVSNVANCKVAVLVTCTTGESSQYFVNNIIECPVGESVPFAYK